MTTQNSKKVFKLDDFVPDLRKVFEERSFDPAAVLHAMLPVQNPAEHSVPVPTACDRRHIVITDGKENWVWEVESLQGLFRGDKQPPVLGDYPEAYDDAFMLLDLHFLDICNVLGDRRDAEIREIYSTLRKRPDGRSLGVVHDHMWRAAAIVLGTRPLSQAEFEAITARLERSCRRFEEGSTSRNFAPALRTVFSRVW